MKQMHTIAGAPTHPAAGSQNASLNAFLDVADRLYDRVTCSLKGIGLSYAKYDVLSQLHRTGGPLSLGLLAEGQRCAASNITQLVDRLESEGLVRRVDDPDDRRSVRAELTPEGARLAEEGTRQIEALRAQFVSGFTAAELAQLGRLLDKIR